MRAALRSSAQVSYSPFAGWTAMAGRTVEGRTPGARDPSQTEICQASAVAEKGEPSPARSQLTGPRFTRQTTNEHHAG